MKKFSLFFVFVFLFVSQIFSNQCFDQWQKTKSYISGEKVSYSGKNYEAKWWTLGIIPGSQTWDSDWKELGICGETKDTVKQNDKTNCFPTYKANNVYLNGDEVNFLGKNYRAKWWTTSIPAGSFDWEDLGVCKEETIIDFRDTTKEKISMESVSQFLLFATNDILLNSGVKIAGNIGANNKVSVGMSAGWQTIVNGDIYSKGKVSTSAEATINGDVYANGGLELGWMAKHNGELFKNHDYDFSIEKKTIPNSSKNYDGKWLEKINLPVGNYNNVSVKDGGNLQLSKGVYNARTLSLNSNDLEIKLNISAGENVELNVQDSLHLGSGAKVVFAGTSKKAPLNFKIYTNQTHDLIIPDHSEINAIITAPNAKVIVNSGAKVNGAIYAKEIEVKYEAVINGVPYITDIFHSQYHFAPNFDVKTAEYKSVVSSNAAIDFVEVNNPRNYKITKTNTTNKYVFEVEDTISKLVSYYSLNFEFNHSDYAVFVNKNAANGGTGKSWGTAINNLQEAIKVAKKEGKEIRVAEGTYENIVIGQGTKIIGGFMGMESDQEPTGSPYNTIISGNKEKQVVVMQGFENAKSFKIKGVVIEHGYSETNGAGISCEKVIPKLEEIIVQYNTAKENGAGIYAPRGVQDLHMLLVESNTGKSAFYLEKCDSIKAERIVVSQNSSIGIYAKNAGISFINSIFYKNKTAISADSSNFEIIHNTFAKNDTGIVAKNSKMTIVNTILWNEKKELNGNGFAVSFSCVKGGYSGQGNISDDPLFVDIDNPKGEDGQWGTYDDGLIVKESKLKGTKIVSENNLGDVEQDILLRYRNKDNPTMGAYEFQPKEANTMVFGKMYDGQFVETGGIDVIGMIMHPKEVYWYSGSNYARTIRMYVENNEYTRKKDQIEITFNSFDTIAEVELFPGAPSKIKKPVYYPGVKMFMHKVGEENGILIFQSLTLDYKGKQVLFVDTPYWHNWDNDWAYIVQIKQPFRYRIDVKNDQFF